MPGSSDYFERGVVCYSNRAKEEWLGVPGALIAAHGAVSEPVAQRDGRRYPRSGAVRCGHRNHRYRRTRRRDAGEAGRHRRDRRENAVGAQRVRTFQFLGGRDMVKFQSAQAAMNMLRLMLLNA